MSAKQDFQIKKWQGLIREYQRSGKKLKDWCADNNISRYQYYYWLSKVRANYYEAAVNQLQTTEASDNTTFEVKNSSFVELNPEMVNEAFKQANQPVAIIKKDNIRIEIMANASASFIRQLITAVQYA